MAQSFKGLNILLLISDLRDYQAVSKSNNSISFLCAALLGVSVIGFLNGCFNCVLNVFIYMCM